MAPRTPKTRKAKANAKANETTVAIEEKNIVNQVRESIKFHDVRESLNVFTGDDTYSIIKWIEDLEEMSEVCGWSDVELFIYSKRLLSGTAALYLRSETGIKSWNLMRECLMNEFRNNLTSADVHRQLTARIKNNDESHQQYLFKMMEIAKQGDVSEDSLLDYVIAGIQDSEVNKALLYGATTISDFKIKLQLYVKMKSRMHISESGTSRVFNVTAGNIKQNSTSGVANTITRCYNCGSKTHQHRECPNLDKGPKCFACRSFGHKSTECPDKETQTKQVNNDEKPQVYQVNAINTNERIFKEINVLGIQTLALKDTGCDLNLCRQSLIKGIDAVNAEVSLSGPAGTMFCTKKKFITELEVDNATYTVEVYSVPDEDIMCDFIIGRSLFQTNAELKISPGVIEINKITIETNEFDVGSREHYPVIRSMIANYVPCATKTTPIKTKIIVSDEEPIYQRSRRLSPKEKAVVESQVEEWIKEGIIRPSCSDYASPIVIVPKKDGSFRVCVDYRRLNNKIIKDRYPLPLIEDQLDKLQGARIFSTLDLKNGFFHVAMDEESIKYTSFITPEAQYEFMKTPFGLCIAPPIFQRFINYVFKDIMRMGYLLIYMDDLVIISSTVEENIERLKIVLRTSANHGLKINWKKCQFLKKEIDYLGYRIKHNELSPSPLKLAAVVKYPRLQNAKHIQSFLGLTGYFRKFIKDYALIARPLSEILKKSIPFVIGPQQENAFNMLKEKLTEAPVLGIFNPEAVTEVHTDASMYGFGAILLQKDPDNLLHPIYFMSKKTTQAQQRYHSYELEVLAIVEAVKKFRSYLLGLQFKIVTDCAAFTKTLEKRELATRVARWALLLSEFNYTIEHRAGSNMAHVDALSRYPICMTINSEFIAQLQKAQQNDIEVKTLTSEARMNGCGSYIVENDLLYETRDDRKLLVIPKGMQKELIRNAHNVGHFGVKKVVELLDREYSISNVREKVERFIQNCVPCILINRKQGKQEGFLNTIDKGDLPLHTWHIDFLGPLTNTPRGYKHILAIIDAFTKFCWLFPTRSTTSKEVVDKMNILQATFGNPTRLISDRGAEFTSGEFKKYCSDSHIHHVQITTGMPRGNGQVERLNDTIATVVAKLTIDDPGQWFKYVPRVQMALNSSWQRSINMTPFKLTFGTEMKHPDLLPLCSLIKEEYAKSFLEKREAERQEAKQCILKAQQEQKKTFDHRRVAATDYRIGDLVAIKRTQFLPLSKIKSKYLGPYRITGRCGPNRYAVWKVGSGEGPEKTSTGTDYMKKWKSCLTSDEEDSVSEADSA